MLEEGFVKKPIATVPLGN